MTLKLMKPGLGYLRSGLRVIEHKAPEQTVERLRGNTLAALRRRLLARCGGLCECGACPSGYPIKITLKTMEADHHVPLHLGGDNSLANFRALHRDCHKRITAEQASARANRVGTWSDRL